MNTKLDVKQWAIASVAVFVVLSILAFLSIRLEESIFTGLVLRPETTQDTTMLRVWNYLGRLIFSLVFVLVYTKGIGGKSALVEGLRYGFWMGLLMPLSGFFASLVGTTWPTSFLVTNGLVGLVTFVIAGITAGLLYKKPVGS